MATCAIKWCGKSKRSSNFKKDGITFHRFPQCADRKKKWIDATCRGEEWFPTKNSVICSRHFEADAFIETKLRRRLLDSAMPTLHLPILIPSTSTSQNTIRPSSFVGTESPKKRENVLPVPDTPSAFNSPTKKRLCRRVIDLQNKLQSKNKKLKKAHDCNRRLKKKITSLKSLLIELERKNLISEENINILNSVGVKCSEIIKRQIMKGKSGTIVRKKYSPELRAFALTLNFYSTKAYKYVRKTFNTCLPCVKTLGKWYSSIDGRPGFTKEAFAAIKIKAEQSKTPLYCCIVFDEMKIKNKVEKNYGYVDFGGCIDSDCREECTDALVYLVVPLHGKWKIPIGYFLIQRVSAETKAFLLTRAVELCHEAQVIIKAVTFDGCPANLAMAKKLGCNLNPDNLKPIFKVNGTEIAIFLDPAHMIKLVRNTFEHYEQFKDAHGNNIEWSHLKALHELQEKEMFHAANKLRAEHLLFKKNIMKVKLATQIFSRSVALALIFCKNTLKLAQFQDVQPTADFLLTLNDLFDILDSKVHGFELKRALNKENSEKIVQKLENCKNILITLTVNFQNQQIRLVDSLRYTGFLGLCICIESAKFLYQHLVANDCVPYISFHRISQDHVELFFCNMRSRGGANDNPTAKQFHGIYKKILVHVELQDTNTGNCVALEKISILHCSSAIKRINLTTERGDTCDTTCEAEAPAQNNFIEAIQHITLSHFSESIIEYISGAVVHYLIKYIKCNTCVKALVSLHEKQTSLIFARDTGGLIYPSRTVIKICKRCEQVVRCSLKKDPQNSKICYKDKFRLVTETLRSFVNEDLFPQLNRHQFDHESCNHLIDLAKSVMEKYIDIRLLYLTRKSDPKSAVRRVYTKLVHFKNQ